MFTVLLPYASRPSEEISILFIRNDKIGDLLVSTPVFASLRARFPNARMDVLLGRHNAGMGSLLSMWNIGSHVYTKTVFGTIRLLSSLRGSYSVVVDMMDNPSRTSGLLLQLLAPGASVGFDNGRQRPVTHAVPLPDRSKVHIVDCMAELVRPFGVDPDALDRRPILPADYGYRSHTSCDILVHISAGKDSLRWSSDRFISLIQTLKSEYANITIAIGAGPADRSNAEHIAKMCGVNVLPATSSFADYTSQVRGAEFIITPDTSIVHLASALNIPAVVLYAKPHPDRLPWYPYNVPYRAVVSSTDHGIESISAAQVASALRSLRDEVSSREVFDVVT